MNAVRQPLQMHQFGQGTRPVLALHCTLAHAGAWRGVAAGLSDLARFHAPDMYNHGRSPDWDGQGGFSDDMLAALLTQMDQPMDVVGHSFGAVMALRLAVEHPDLVRSLTIVESVLFAAVASAEALEEDLRSGAMAPVRQALAAGDDALAARLFNRGWGDRSGPKWDQMPDKTRAALTRGVRVLPACDPAVLRDRPGVLAAGRLEGLPMPCLLVEGGETDASVRAIHDVFQARIPNTTRIAVPGAGHMVPITHPDPVAQALRTLMHSAPVAA